MNFAHCIVVLAIMVSVEAVPTPAIELPATDPDYFTKKLESVQGAIKDSLRAGKDLQTMEEKLQAIVNLSSYFYLTESATEYATERNAYPNGWKPDDDAHAMEFFGVACTGVATNIYDCAAGIKQEMYGGKHDTVADMCPATCYQLKHQ